MTQVVVFEDMVTHHSHFNGRYGGRGQEEGGGGVSLVQGMWVLVRGAGARARACVCVHVCLCPGVCVRVSECVDGWVKIVCVCVCVCAVSYTHLTLPTSDLV